MPVDLFTYAPPSLSVYFACPSCFQDNSSDLSQALRTHAQSFIDEFPMVAPAEFKVRCSGDMRIPVQAGEMPA